MDNVLLEPILTNLSDRQFWLKPIGDSIEPVDFSETFSADPIRIDFAKRPRSVRIGDVVLVYRTRATKVLYVGICNSEMFEATDEEISQTSWRGHWRWSVWAHNLTPEYGSVWNEYDLHLVGLSNMYGELNPENLQRINGNWLRGHDKLRIKRPFAEFVMRKIASL